ncbi:MAG: DUF1599 domain-containing protein [Oscillospiraceae bacterium]|nr:DUF1599 domain-containing protein [Oscillospiraceae bacterium]
MLTSAQIEREYMDIISKCKNIFKVKDMEYGATWAIYRWSSLTDQLWMKIKRIRTIEESGSKIPEPIAVEYIALINYAIIFLFRLKNTALIEPPEKIIENTELLNKCTNEKIMELYELTVKEAYELYQAKNHDYNNAWQDMSSGSITDLIIIKVLRMKNIIKQKNNNIQSLDVDQQLFDIINYSIFALIKMQYSNN